MDKERYLNLFNGKILYLYDDVNYTVAKATRRRGKLWVDQTEFSVSHVIEDKNIATYLSCLYEIERDALNACLEGIEELKKPIQERLAKLRE